MINIIMGEKGSGKTKAFIEKVNNSVKQEKGNVVCITKGNRHLFDFTSAVRLTDISEFPIVDYHALLGFICGMLSQDYDITHIFIDSITKIAGDDFAEFDAFLQTVETLGSQYRTSFTMTVSAPISSATEQIKQYCV